MDDGGQDGRDEVVWWLWVQQFILLVRVMERRHSKNKSHSKRVEDIKYCRTLKTFLSSFKTHPCTLQQQHRLEHCPYYHSLSDYRRPPYTPNGLLYYHYTHCLCDNPHCPSYHTQYQYIYHPHIYKTTPCNRNPCDAPPNVCPMLHKGENMYFQQGEFFRFDINTFKTNRCQRNDQHQRKVCLGYHYQKDRRRPNFNDYSHIPCTKNKPNCNCQRSHNKIEQLYHPTRYKTKFCQHYGKDPTACQYRDFCSFAHTKEEILIQLIDPDNKDPNYVINTYKTVWCPYTQDHDRGQCPYAHNIQDYRRKPSVYHYEPVKCPKWDFSNKIQSIEASECEAGMNCNKCHGWMEHRYHPAVYKPKTVQKNYVKKEELIDRKLKDPMKKDKEKYIETIISKDVEKNKQMYAVGAPFFKNQRQQQRQYSEASHPTKPKSGKNSNLDSNSCNMSTVNDSKNQRKSLMGRPQKKHHISSVYFQSEQHQLWQCDSIDKDRNSDGRSKSQGNSSQFQNSYSRSIKELVNDPNIIDKLYSEKVNEVSLISMNDRKVNDMFFLSHSEKQKLSRRLRQYHLCKNIGYSLKLTHFFSVHNAEPLLDKLRLKKLTEERVLKLTRQAIKQFEFLKEEEKELLPKLLKKYSMGKQFDTLRVEVQEYVSKEEVGDV